MYFKQTDSLYLQTVNTGKDIVDTGNLQFDLEISARAYFLHHFIDVVSKQKLKKNLPNYSKIWPILLTSIYSHKNATEIKLLRWFLDTFIY